VSEELARQYRGRVILGHFSPVDPPEVGALEHELGQAIPPANWSLLEVTNGGTLGGQVTAAHAPGPGGCCCSRHQRSRQRRAQ
jgi:hypothetical protein